jgi:carbamoyl-phosphate synthase large subunit
MARPSARVAISGFGGLDNPEPGTPVARALRLAMGRAVAIEALGYDPWLTGAYSPGLVDRVHLATPLAGGDEAVLARLLEIRHAHPFDVLLPCLDLEVPVFARLGPRLAQAGIRTLLPAPERLQRVTKAALPMLCYEHGIATPRTLLVPNVDDVPFHADQFGYPLMVKGTVAGAKRANTREDAYAEARRLNAIWGGGVLLQEVIEGDEYNAAMVARGDGSCLGLVLLRKLGVNWRGKSVIGAVVDDPDFERDARAILAKLRWRGPLELEFVRSYRDRQLYLIEVNNRFPSWILVSHWAGCNLPAMLVREILGREPGGARRGRAGVAYVRDVEEVAVPEATVETLGRLGSAEGRPPVAGRRPTRPGAARGRQGLRVAVTGISSFNDVMPGLGVARALARAPEVAAVYGLGSGAYDTGCYRGDLFRAVFHLPAVQEPGPLLERIRAIQADTGVEMIIPCTDVDVRRFIEIGDDLARIGVRALLPSAAAFARVDKRQLLPSSGRRDWGAFYVPETALIRSADAMTRRARALGFPLVVKGLATEAQTVYTQPAAEAAWRRLRQQGQQEVLVQRHVPGEEFAVSAVCDADHRIVASAAIKKLKQCERGKTWAARAVALPALTESLGAMLQEFGWHGPVEAEFIRDAFRERFALLEVNPRFPAWIGFSADAGSNLPRQAVRLALGEPPLGADEDQGALFARNCRELFVETVRLAALATDGVMTHA